MATHKTEWFGIAMNKIPFFRNLVEKLPSFTFFCNSNNVEDFYFDDHHYKVFKNNKSDIEDFSNCQQSKTRYRRHQHCGEVVLESYSSASKTKRNRKSDEEEP